MTTLVTRARPLLLAVLTSLTLASCFDHDKKCDPKPAGAAGCPGHSSTTTPTTGSDGHN